MKKMLDFYFHRPMLYDFFLSIGIIGFYLILKFKMGLCLLNISGQIVKDITQSLIGTSVTLAGFLLTILTIVITFKNNFDGRKGNKKEEGEDENNGVSHIGKATKMEIFFSSSLYFKSVRLITFGIVEFGGIFIFMIITQFQLIKISPNSMGVLLICVIISSILVFSRCIFVLHQITQFQQDNTKLT